MNDSHRQAILARERIIDHSRCEECEEDYVFDMRRGGRAFRMGLRTVLACLSLAQQEGAVPELPDEWWNTIGGRYR